MEIEIAPLGIGFILLHITAKITNFIFSSPPIAEKIPKFIKSDSLSHIIRQNKKKQKEKLKIFTLILSHSKSHLLKNHFMHIC